MHASAWVRRSALLLVVFALVGCPGNDLPVLSVSAGSLRVGGEVAVNVSAAVGAQPGTGTVELSASLGELGSASVALVEGAGRTTLRCPRTTPGCVAGASITLTARWNGSTETATVRVIDPAVIDAGPDAGGPDAGRADAGADAGTIDAGRIDFSAASVLVVDAGFVVGPFSATRTMGFSPLEDSSTVRLGFDSMPDSPVLVGGRLLYLRRGSLFAWVDDAPDGAVTPGPDGGLFPLFAPERNDLALESGCGEIINAPGLGVATRLVRKASDQVWAQCQLRLDAGLPRYFKSLGTGPFLSQSGGQLLAGDDVGVLVTSGDGGLFFETEGLIAAAVMPPVRQYGWPAARRRAPEGFEVLGFDPASNRCRLVTVRVAADFSELTLSEQALPPSLPASPACLTWRFVGDDDVLAGLDPNLGIVSVTFTRRTSDGGSAGVDGGRDGSDGGVDGGAADAGPVPFFEPGPPSDLLAQPPRLSIDLNDSRGVQLLTP